MRGGTIVTHRGPRPLDVAITSGRFSALAPRGELAARGREEIDATGLHVLPGIIDPHVHFREPGFEYEEDWLTGTRAAVMGGVTTVLEMPNTRPPTSTAERARAKSALAAGSAFCDHGLFALIDPGHPDELRPMVRQGLVVGAKAFLGPTTGDIPTLDDAALTSGLASAAALGIRTSVHAEDGPMIETREWALRAAGRVDFAAHGDARPAAAEALGIERTAVASLGTGAPVHICHVSSIDGLTAVERARARGVDMTTELTPHHGFLSDRDIPSHDWAIGKVNPPLRDASHPPRLMDALARGVIDMVASDHAPHLPDASRGPDIWSAHSGFTGVELLARIYLTAVADGRLSLRRFVQATAEAPARAFGLWPLKGHIAVGADADLTIVDLSARAPIRAAELHGKGAATPFEGREVVAPPIATVIRGRIVMREGDLLTGPGWGRPVARSPIHRRAAIRAT